MGSLPFDREIINFREKPISSDINYAGLYADTELRQLVNRLYGGRIPGMSGVADSLMPAFWQAQFLGDGYKVRPSGVVATPFVVAITPGLGFRYDASDVPVAIGGVVGIDDSFPLKPMALSNTQAVTIDPAPGAGLSRIDILEVKTDRRSTDSTVREIMNNSGVFVPGTVNKTLSFDHYGRTGRVVSPAASTTGVGYKVGLAATTGTEAAPSPTSGYTLIAEIYVADSTTTIGTENIKDCRYMAFPHGCGEVSFFAKVERDAGTGQKMTIKNVVAPPGVVVGGYAGTTLKGEGAVIISAGEGLGAVPGWFTSYKAVPAHISMGYVTNAAIQVIPVGVMAYAVPLTVAMAANLIDTAKASPVCALAGGASSAPGFIGQTVLYLPINWAVDLSLGAFNMSASDLISFSVHIALGR